MTITPEQKQAVATARGGPVRLEDPETQEAYFLVKERAPENGKAKPPENFVPGPGRTLPMGQNPNEPPLFTDFKLNDEVAEGIEMAYEAFRRDLPEMMKDKKLNKKWVLYQRGDRIAVGKRQHELHRKAGKLGLAEDEFVAFLVEPEDEDVVFPSSRP